MVKDVYSSMQGIEQINSAKWQLDEYGTVWLRGIYDKFGMPVEPWLMLRPSYCDRGHIQLCIEGHLSLDGADSFPRYFFSFEEADSHVRTFLKWRLWKYRVHAHVLSIPPEKRSQPFNAPTYKAM